MKQYKYRINGSLYNVVISNTTEKTAEVEVNGTPYTIEIEKKKTKKPISSPFKKHAQAGAMQPENVATPAPRVASTGGTNALISPLPGVILDINCKVGDVVKKGQKLLVLEAMKMENNINADKDGTIKEIKVEKGESVLEGSELIVIEG